MEQRVHRAVVSGHGQRAAVQRGKAVCQEYRSRGCEVTQLDEVGEARAVVHQVGGADPDEFVALVGGDVAGLELSWRSVLEGGEPLPGVEDASGCQADDPVPRVGVGVVDRGQDLDPVLSGQVADRVGEDHRAHLSSTT